MRPRIPPLVNFHLGKLEKEESDYIKNYIFSLQAQIPDYDEDDDTCRACSGTGEGQFDGQSCSCCKGSG